MSFFGGIGRMLTPPKALRGILSMVSPFLGPVGVGINGAMSLGSLLQGRLDPGTLMGLAGLKGFNPASMGTAGLMSSFGKMGLKELIPLIAGGAAGFGGGTSNSAGGLDPYVKNLVAQMTGMINPALIASNDQQMKNAYNATRENSASLESGNYSSRRSSMDQNGMDTERGVEQGVIRKNANLDEANFGAQLDSTRLQRTLDPMSQTLSAIGGAHNILAYDDQLNNSRRDARNNSWMSLINGLSPYLFPGAGGKGGSAPPSGELPKSGPNSSGSGGGNFNYYPPGFGDIFKYLGPGWHG